jgi:hypothetical protein
VKKQIGSISLSPIHHHAGMFGKVSAFTLRWWLGNGSAVGFGLQRDSSNAWHNLRAMPVRFMHCSAFAPPN